MEEKDIDAFIWQMYRAVQFVNIIGWLVFIPPTAEANEPAAQASLRPQRVACFSQLLLLTWINKMLQIQQN